MGDFEVKFFDTLPIETQRKILNGELRVILTYGDEFRHAEWCQLIPNVKREPSDDFCHFVIKCKYPDDEPNEEYRAIIRERMQEVQHTLWDWDFPFVIDSFATVGAFCEKITEVYIDPQMEPFKMGEVQQGARIDLYGHRYTYIGVMTNGQVVLENNFAQLLTFGAEELEKFALVEVEV